MEVEMEMEMEKSLHLCLADIDVGWGPLFLSFFVFSFLREDP